MKKLDVIQFSIVVITIFTIYQTLTNADLISDHYVFEIVIAILIILMAIFYFLHRLEIGSSLYDILFALTNSMMQSEPFSTDNKPGKLFANNFPYGVFVLLSSVFLVILLLDICFANSRINDAIYGLSMDGIGAVLLGSDTFFTAKQLKIGNVSDFSGTGRSHEISTYHFWGIIFLVFGFILQIFSILIFGLAVT